MKRRFHLLILGASVLLSAGTVAAQTLGPRTASDLVTLQPGPLDSCPDNSGAYALNVRINSDGTTSAFSIPNNQVLVVTGMDWGRCVSGNPNVLISLVPYHTSGPGEAAQFAFLFAIAGDNGCGGGNTALTGVAVQAGQTICIPANATSDQQRVHGYLTPRGR
jgi:hypothetical protein